MKYELQVKISDGWRTVYAWAHKAYEPPYDERLLVLEKFGEMRFIRNRWAREPEVLLHINRSIPRA